MGDRRRFRDAALAPPSDGRLAEAALCLAAEARAGLDVDEELARLADLAAGCPGHLAGLRTYLFDQVGFRGNTRRYYDPRNSYLDEVRRRRLGIPITLSILAMEVGRHAGVPLLGVGLPGHFLTRSADDPSAYLDAFSGRLLSTDGVAYLFTTISGGRELEEHWLEPVGPEHVVRRMLANLRQVFAHPLRDDSLLWVLELELTLPGAAEEVRAARAACMARLFRVAEARAEFEALAGEAEERGDHDVAKARAQQAQAAVARLQ